MLELLTQPETWISLATLIALEVVLGVDNIVFISILTDRLAEDQRPRARTIGLALALIMRVGLLFAISWVMRLTTPLFDLFGRGFAGRDLILIVGGLFLVGKATFEIHDNLEVVHDDERGSRRKVASFASVFVQILLLDIVFSLDSVITAVGMVDEIAIMVAAVIVAVLVMMLFAGPIGRFVGRHPSMKMLALSFLILVGVMLVVEGMGRHVPKGYIYFAMAFSFGVEMLNMRLRKGQKPVALHRPYAPDSPQAAGADAR
jgi:predicted tellurium resistance membrane protein TerC